MYSKATVEYELTSYTKFLSIKVIAKVGGGGISLLACHIFQKWIGPRLNLLGQFFLNSFYQFGH